MPRKYQMQMGWNRDLQGDQLSLEVHQEQSPKQSGRHRTSALSSARAEKTLSIEWMNNHIRLGDSVSQQELTAAAQLVLEECPK